jgi:hypothetical protein
MLLYAMSSAYFSNTPDKFTLQTSSAALGDIVWLVR